ncbi:hypothetical protein [Ovoidimarina sediminis]|uniref:hypothetical protein n=1 Tax=Ovoidimarina sediminis TaxID=3079856 RepID=UPI002914B401|nr:hypothetical protein [Rhodophyticola sp. MJ-SS7]MDU8946541.1 hypothetical protein [Rhodophyticola sp. MJ-SS7]
MNGKSEQDLIESIMHQIEDGALRQKHEIDALLECLLDCVRELTRLRKQSAAEGDAEKTADAICQAEMRARRTLASHLKGLSDAEREGFCLGKIDPADVWLGVGHSATGHNSAG